MNSLTENAVSMICGGLDNDLTRAWRRLGFVSESELISLMSELTWLEISEMSDSTLMGAASAREVQKRRTREEIIRTMAD